MAEHINNIPKIDNINQWTSMNDANLDHKRHRLNGLARFPPSFPEGRNSQGRFL